MWIFAKDGFLSIVKHRDKEDSLLVRARIKGDIEHFFPTATIEVDAGTDYKYRTTVHQADVAGVIYDTVNRIDYDNFKNSIKGKRRSFWYGMIWQIMFALQEELSNK